MKKLLIITCLIISLALPALSLSSTSEVPGREIVTQLTYDAQRDRNINLYTINFKNIDRKLGELPADKQSTRVKSYGEVFNVLKSTQYAGNNTRQPIVSNVHIEPYFGDKKKAFKSTVFELPSTFGDVLTMGSAFLTNLAAHEFGHALVGEHVGATGNTVNFFNKRGGQFFLGMSSVKNIKRESKLPYTMGGEFFADLTFEHALKSYRKNPNSFNTYLMLYSGTDFLWYCIYAFYVTDGHANFDPVTISKETGLSHDELFSIVLAKTLINTYRIYSGQDKVVPYFTVDSSSAALNLSIPF